MPFNVPLDIHAPYVWGSASKGQFYFLHFFITVVLYFNKIYYNNSEKFIAGVINSESSFLFIAAKQVYNCKETIPEPQNAAIIPVKFGNCTCDILITFNFTSICFYFFKHVPILLLTFYEIR